MSIVDSPTVYAGQDGGPPVERAVVDVHARRGRRPLVDDAPAGEHSPQVSFRVPEQTRRRAEKRARAEGRSVSDLAREALEPILRPDHGHGAYSAPWRARRWSVSSTVTRYHQNTESRETEA